MGHDDIAVVVDDDDQVIGYKKSGKTTTERIRISAIWIENSSGEVLIAQRHEDKKLHPLKWGPAAVGTVEKGETYEENAYKELSEEIGVTGFKLQEFKKQLYQHNSSAGKRSCMWYRLTLDWPIEKFILQPDEVKAVKWVSKDWLKNDIEKFHDKYVPSAETWQKVFDL